MAAHVPDCPTEPNSYDQCMTNLQPDSAQNSVAVLTSTNNAAVLSQENNSTALATENSSSDLTTENSSALANDNRSVISATDYTAAQISTADFTTEGPMCTTKDSPSCLTTEDTFSGTSVSTNEGNTKENGSANSSEEQGNAIPESIKIEGCICTDDTSKESVESFTCAECTLQFPTICCLHLHLKEHASQGSYFYDHMSQTAFPQRQSEFQVSIFSQDKKPNRRSKGRPKKYQQWNEVKKESDYGEESSVERKKIYQTRPKRNRRKAKALVNYYEDEVNSGTDQPHNDFDSSIALEMDVTEEMDDVQNFDEVDNVDENRVKLEVTQDNRPFKKRKIVKKVYLSTKPKAKRGRKPSIKGSNVNGVPKLAGIESGAELHGDINGTGSLMDQSIKQESGTLGKGTSGPLNPKSRRKRCDICGMNITVKGWLSHQREHTGERPFVCEKCGKAFARNRFLRKHLITHETVKPWRCAICPAQFCQKTEFNMHMAGHEGNRPFVCNVCDKRFLSKKSLLTHQANIHMGLTHFECEVCGRRFFKKSSLNVHLATHYEAKMKCSFCDKKFRDKTGLQRHERTHTGVKKFQCHVCYHGFIQSTPFWVHMEKRHGMCRTKLKAKLEEVKESNRRSGIPTDILVLPEDQDKEILHTYKKPMKGKGKHVPNTDQDEASQPLGAEVGHEIPSKFTSDEFPNHPDIHLMHNLYSEVNSEPKQEELDVYSKQTDDGHYYKPFKPVVLSSLLSANFAASVPQDPLNNLQDMPKPVIQSSTSLVGLHHHGYMDLSSQHFASELSRSLQRTGAEDFKK